MTNYILKRAGLAMLSLFFLTLFSYALLATFAVDPFLDFDAENPEDALKKAAQLRETAGFNKPIFIRYFVWLGKIFQGNIGRFYQQSQSSRDLSKAFFGPLQYSVRFIAPSLVIGAILGISLGLVAGYNRGTWIDFSANIFVKIFISLPSFVLAPFLLIAARKLGFEINLDPRWGVFDPRAISALIMPILLSVIVGMAGYANYSRNLTVDILTSNHVLIAKAKGLSSREIFFKHIARNISIPLMAIIIPSFTALLGGSFIIEQFFGIPGTSEVFINAFPNGEIDVNMFSILFFGSISLFLLILIDGLTVVFDPRIRIAAKSEINIFKKIKWEIQRKKMKNKERINNGK